MNAPYGRIFSERTDDFAERGVIPEASGLGFISAAQGIAWRDGVEGSELVLGVLIVIGVRNPLAVHNEFIFHGFQRAVDIPHKKTVFLFFHAERFPVIAVSCEKNLAGRLGGFEGKPNGSMRTFSGEHSVSPYSFGHGLIDPSTN